MGNYSGNEINAKKIFPSLKQWDLEVIFWITTPDFGVHLVSVGILPTFLPEDRVPIFTKMLVPLLVNPLDSYGFGTNRESDASQEGKYMGLGPRKMGALIGPQEFSPWSEAE